MAVSVIQCLYWMINHVVYLGLGSNLGDRETNIEKAIKKIEESVGLIDRRSSFYYSKPWGFHSENNFVNVVICVITKLEPRELLFTTQRIERSMGRTEKSINKEYHDREIDIDILIYDDIHINEPDLQIPHPLMAERDFVIQPLNEIFNK